MSCSADDDDDDDDDDDYDDSNQQCKKKFQDLYLISFSDSGTKEN
jgi:hypothetical protein